MSRHLEVYAELQPFGSRNVVAHLRYLRPGSVCKVALASACKIVVLVLCARLCTRLLGEGAGVGIVCKDAPHAVTLESYNIAILSFLT